MILARNLLETLRDQELAQAVKDIATETGLEHRPVGDGQRVGGIYRRSVMLASGRYAMLDDGIEGTASFLIVATPPRVPWFLARHSEELICLDACVDSSSLPCEMVGVDL